MVLQRSRLVRLLVAIALVALAATGLRLSDDKDNFEVVRGVLGQPVPINGGTVTASNVRVGTALVRFDKIDARTPGLFVVVQVQVAATGTKPIPPSTRGCSVVTAATSVSGSSVQGKPSLVSRLRSMRSSRSTRPPSTT